MSMATKKKNNPVDSFLYLLSDIITAHKRGLGQGNVSTPVCDSVHEGGVSQHAMEQTTPSSSRADPPGQTHPSDTTLIIWANVYVILVLTAPTFVAQVRKSPDIAEPNRVPNTGQQKLRRRTPLGAAAWGHGRWFLGLFLLFLGTTTALRKHVS